MKSYEFMKVNQPIIGYGIRKDKKEKLLMIYTPGNILESSDEALLFSAIKSVKSGSMMTLEEQNTLKDVE